MSASTSRGPADEASIIELVEKRFRLLGERDQAIHGLGHDDETINSVVDAMDAAMGALDQAIVDRIPETAAEISAQLRLYRERVDHDDERDERLFKSMLAGLAGLAAKGGAGLSAPDPAAVSLVAEMETDVTDAKVFADAIAMVAETVDEQDGAVFQRLAWAIKERCEAIECRRGKLFRLLHPNRDHFEKVGWPGDNPADDGEGDEPGGDASPDDGSAAIMSEVIIFPGIIVNVAEKKALALLDGEPTLAPLARALFQIDEEAGNIIGNPGRKDELDHRCAEVERAINACRAETIGGVAWRLHQLLRVSENEDLSEWFMSILRASIEDAKALAVGQP